MAATAITVFELSEDVITEILARSPVKSLLRFKSVRKSWYGLIKAPKFITKHLNYSSAFSSDHEENARIIAIKHCDILRDEDDRSMPPIKRTFVSFLSDDEAVQQLLSHDIPSPFFDDDHLRSNNIKFYGPCNGVICVLAASLGRIGIGRRDYFIALWNPATREIKRLLDSSLGFRDDAEVVLLDIGFGYDSKSDDYKVVRIIGFAQTETGSRIGDRVVEVYNLSTDSWRRISVVLPTEIYFASGFSTYSNGFYYWLAADDNGKFVLSFDFANEVFEQIPSPDINNPNHRVTTLVEFNKTIAVAAHVSGDAKDIGCVVVWVLNMDSDGENKTWTKLYKIPCEPVCVVGFLRNGEALMIVGNDDGGNELTLYDPNTQLLKNLRVYDSACYSFQMVHYVESLVSFKGA